MATNAYKGRSVRMDAADVPEDVRDEFLNEKTRAPDVLYALLRDAYYKGPVSVGKGGTARAFGSGSPGTGLRRPDGPLYDMPESWRKGILRRAVDLDLLVQTDDADDLDDGRFATTPRGRDLLLDADRCEECGRVRRPVVSTEVVKLSRWSHSKNYHLITACPECESHVGDDYELGDEARGSNGGRDALTHAENVNADATEAVVYANEDPSEFVEDPDPEVQDAQDDAPEPPEEGDRVLLDGYEWTVSEVSRGQVHVRRELDDGRTHSNAFPVESVEAVETDDEDGDGEDAPSDADGGNDDETPEENAQDPTYAPGTTVRVAASDDPLEGEEGTVEETRVDDGDEEVRVEFEDSPPTPPLWFDPDDLSTMRPVRDAQDEPEGPEFDDEPPRGEDADACPPVEVVRHDYETLQEAVDRATDEGVTNAADEDSNGGLLEGPVDALERVYRVADALDYAYAATSLYERLNKVDDEADGLLLVVFRPPEWVAPETRHGVYSCAECGAVPEREGTPGTGNDRPDAPYGWDLLLTNEVHGEESRAVACAECGEQGLLGTGTRPWSCGAILSPVVHRTPPKFR